MDKHAEHSTSQTIANKVLKVYSAIEASGEAIFVTDIKGRIEYVNQRFLALNGWQETETLGRSVSNIPYSKNVALKLLEAMKQGRTWDSRHQIKNPQKVSTDKSGLIWVKTSVSPIMEIPGEITGFVGVQRNINAEVIMELRFKKELGEVLSLAIQRGKALQKSKFKQEQALQQVVTKSEFLASMSHEIRTPLNGVLGMTELLLNTSLSNKQKHLANIIHRSGHTLLDLINDILDLSKIEAGKLELNNSSHDLRLLIEDVASTFAERTNSKGLELTCIYPTKDHTFYFCDKQRLTQLLSNLIGNAIKFTHQGEIIIQTTLIEDTDDQHLVRFEIKDTGAGIPEDKVETIFESFSQIRHEIEPETKGTGLGLAICKHLATLMGGEIGVHSKQGEGSTFWFTARLQKDHSSKPVKPLHEHDHMLKGLKILVVDDNATSRENISDQLKLWDIDAHTADSAATAISMLKQAHDENAPYSLALLDHDMPDIGGLNLARILKENDILAKTPLILLNAISDLEETMVWTSAGIKSYLTKPVRQTELYNCLIATLSLPNRKPDLKEQNTITEAATVRQYNGRVLVAEDNAVNQELAELMLSEHGCEVLIAGNGQKALDAIKENINSPFDLILMDCQMPVMDGYTSSNEIRKCTENLPRVPIVALTANAMEGDRQRCLDAGMDDHLTKPFSRSQLIEILEKWMPGNQSNVESRKQPIISHLSEIPVDNDTTTIEVAEEPSATFVKSDKINYQTLENIRSLQREGAPDILTKIVGLYLDNSTSLIADVEQAVDNRDGNKLRSAAHSLKSSSANLGADFLAAVCKELEAMGKNNQMDESDEKLKQLKEEYRIACEALTNEIS